MKRLAQTKQFVRDVKRMVKRGKDLEKLKTVVTELAHGRPLAPRRRDHPLIGSWQRLRGCRLEPDCLLLHTVIETELRVEVPGTHSDLFKKELHHLPAMSSHPVKRGVGHYKMRLWSLHPKYLDPQSLVALWRESLLAKAVLRGETRGYTHHPQLERFKIQSSPLSAINSYLAAIHAEATTRGYKFDATKIGSVRSVQSIPVNDEQILLEWRHLSQKLAKCNPAVLALWINLDFPACHPVFHVQRGPVASWERTSSDGA